MKKAISIGVILLAVVVVLASCGSSTTSRLEEFAEAQNELFANTNSEAMTIEVIVEGTTLIYVYSIEGIDTAELAETAIDAANALAATLLETAQAAVSGTTAVIIRYVDSDGETLAEREYN